MTRLPKTVPEPGRREGDPQLDLLLIRRIAARDRQAFESLYLSYHDRVTRFLLRLTRRADLAEELFNDVMLVVWQKAPSFRERSRVSTWVLGIAYRKGLKALRRLKRQPEQFTLTAVEAVEAAPSSRDPESRELAEWLDRGLASLSPEHRMVIELAYYLGHSCAEISEIAKCPVNTVKTRMFHARKKLREILPPLGSSGSVESPT